MKKVKSTKGKVKPKKEYIENIGELKGLNFDIKCRLIADALLNGKRIER